MKPKLEDFTTLHVPALRWSLALQALALNPKQAADKLVIRAAVLRRWQQDGCSLGAADVARYAARLGVRADWLAGAVKAGTEELWAQARRLYAARAPGIDAARRLLLRADWPLPGEGGPGE